MSIWHFAQYGFNPFSIPPSIVGVLIALLGVSSLFYERRFRVKIPFLCMTLSVMLWLVSFGILFSLRHPTPAEALRWCRLAHVGVSFIPSFMLLFISSIFKSPRWFRKWAISSIWFSAFFCFIALKTSLWIQGVRHFFWGDYSQYGFFSFFFLAFFFSALLSGLGMLWHGYRSALSKRAKSRLKALIIAFGISFLACTDYLANYGLTVYPFGYIPILFFVLLTAETMRRYRLSDLSPAFAAHQILETMQSIVLVLDLDGLIRVANHAACETLGYENYELIGKPGRQIIQTRETEDTSETPLAEHLLKKNSDTIRGYPMTWLSKKGCEIHLSVSASVLRDQHRSKAEGVVYAAIDLTERIRAEQALRESEDRFQLLTENVRDYAIFMLDAKGNVETWNLGAERIKGFRMDDIVGSHFSCFYTPEDIQNHKPEEDLEIATRYGFVEREGWRMRKDGSQFWAHVTITSLRNRSGILQGFLKIEGDFSEKKRAEAVLMESEDRFRSVTESAHDAIISVDSEWKITSWNKGARTIFGYSNEEVFGRALDFLIPERYRGLYQKGLEQIQATGEIPLLGKVVELTGVRKTGEEFSLELSLSNWKVKQGMFLSAIIRDITLRKQLQEERDRYFNSSLDLICVADFKGYLKQLNPAWEKILGWAPEELKAKHYLELIHPNDRAEAEKEFLGLVKGEETIAFENRFLCKDGSFKWIQWNATGFLEKSMVFAVGRDITDIRKTREIKMRLASIVESSNDAIFTVSLDGEIINWNRGAERMYGYTSIEVVKQQLSILFSPNRIKEMKKAIDGEGKVCGLENYETVCVCKDGKQIQVAFTISPVQSDRLSAVSLIGRNITKLKEAEEVLRRRKDLEMKSNFISMVSHELRTPLTVIKMGVDILQGGETGELNPQQAEWIEMCSRNISRLTRLINKVLDFQKLEGGRMQYDFKEENLNQIILDLDQTARLLLKGKKVALKLELAADLPSVMMDHDKILEVLINLLDNAAKFTSLGTITVRTELKNGKILVSVCDTGIGIEAKNITQLFSSFTQVHSVEHKTGGSGLGLVIAKKIVEQHQGRMWVESEYGSGTVFYFELPLGLSSSIV